MTVYYLDSAGSNTAPYDTWAKAATTIAVLNALPLGASDEVYVAQGDNESAVAATVTIACSVVGTPNKMICGTTAAAPPTTAAVMTNTISSTAANPINVSGSGYFYGIKLAAGSGASGAILTVGATGTSVQYWENSTLAIGSSSAASRVVLGQNSTSIATEKVILRGCTLSFGGAAQKIELNNNVEIIGGGLAGTSLTGSAFITTGNRPSNAVIDGFDMSSMASNTPLVTTAASHGKIIFRDCKLPATWTSGTIFTAAPSAPGLRGELYNCSGGTANYKLRIEDYTGTITDEIAIVKTTPAGASDGVTPYSWKMVTSANAKFPGLGLYSPELFYWNSTVSGSVTLTVALVHSAVGGGTAGALTDKEAWLEVEFLGSAATPIASIQTDSSGTSGGTTAGSPLAAAADQATDTSTWASPPATPLYQKLSVTIAPRMVGMYIVRVVLAGASDTVYVDPKLVIS